MWRRLVDDYLLRVWLRQRLTAREYRTVLGMDAIERINGAVLGGRRIITPHEQELLRNFERIKAQYGEMTLDQRLRFPEVLLDDRRGDHHGATIDDDPRRGIANNSIRITQ